MTSTTSIEAYRKRVSQHFLALSRTPHEKLRFVTTIIDAVVVGVDDDVGARLREEVGRHHVRWRSTMMVSGRIARHAEGQTRWAEVIELDLLHPRMTCSGLKAELLGVFGIDTGNLRPEQRILILHAHGVVDCRGHASVDAVMRDLREAYPGPRRVHAGKLYAEGSVRENLSNLAGYVTKCVHRYSRAWDGQRTTYYGNYEPEWRDFVLKAYEAINYSRLLNSNIIVQSVRPAGAAGMYAPDGIPTGEISLSDPLQLIVHQTATGDDHNNLEEQQDHGRVHEEEDEENMRIHEIIKDYINPDTITPETYNDIINALERDGIEPMTPETMQAMYRPEDEKEELECELLRLDVAKTAAEVRKLDAAAARDQATARSISTTSEKRPAG